MHLNSAHVHPQLTGITLIMQEDGRSNCLHLSDYDHPVHHIDAREPQVRQRNCECHFGDAIRIAEAFRKERTNASFREGNHRQHSRRLDRRAPKRVLLSVLAEAA